MADFLYQSGWGAFTVLLAFQLPFAAVFLYIVFRKAYFDSSASEASPRKFSRVETIWMSGVIGIFLLVNILSIPYFPAISTSHAAKLDGDIQEVDVTAQSWSYEISEREYTVGKPVRFNAKSADTVHGFAIYHPNGRILFTMMLIPGVSKSSLIYTFKDPGTYKVRCLEYCGLAHHDMNDELIVKASGS